MKKLIQYSLIVVVLLLIWDANILQPLRVFSGYIHQTGHWIMSFLFSYKKDIDITVNLTGTGYQVIHQKSFISAFLIANGGYMASLSFALFSTYLKDSPSKKFVPGFYALAFAIIAYFYSDSSEHILYATFFAVLSILLHMLNKEALYDFTLNIYAMSSLAFIFYDVVYNTIFYQFSRFLGFGAFGDRIPYSSAIQLHTLTKIPAIFWGVFWLTIIFISSFFALKESPQEAPAEEPAEES